MLNRRKAMIGWLVYSAAKPLARHAVSSQAKKLSAQQAKTARGKSGEPKRPRVARIAARGAALLAVAGGVLFWRRRRTRDGGPSEP
jgi:hypothetical protein